MMATLSKDYVLRPATMDDVERVVELVNTCSMQRTGQPRTNAEELRVDWTWTEFELARDARVVIAPGGKMVGYGFVRDNAPHERIFASADVHPASLGQGVGTALCRWAEGRARQSVPKAPPGSPVVVWQEALSSDEASHALLRQQDYRPVRHSFHMLLEMDGLPPEPLVPPGISIRPFARGQEVRAVVQAIREAFRDEWDWMERPFEDDFRDWVHYFDTAPNTDPSLWLVALEGDEIVGTCFGHPFLAEDPDLGYVFALGVRRPWRRRGIAQALLRHTFRALYQAGKHKARLGVDAENPTGATRLYEKAGMHVVRQYVIYEKGLRDR
jgi:mycothiol synthase